MERGIKTDAEVKLSFYFWKALEKWKERERERQNGKSIKLGYTCEIL